MNTLTDNRYVLYRRTPNATTGKLDKIPCDEHGRNVDHLDPENWRSYDERAAQATWDETRPDAPYGVAWVLNGDGWFFLDLDNCFDVETGQWSAEAAAIYQSFSGALGEVSVSGTGLHVFGRCDPEQTKDRRNKWDGWLEFYTSGRFVALSKVGPVPIGEWRDVDWTPQLLSLVPKRPDLGPLPEGRDSAYTGPENDDELLAMAMRASSATAAFGGGVTFAHLWNADVERLATKWPSDSGDAFDRSSADAALASHLAFWTGKDMPRMDRLFRQSGLMREKWDRKHRHDGATYGQMTTESAARLCGRVYDRPRPAANASPSVSSVATPADHTGEVYLTVPEMQNHFEGCVYVCDIHRVWTPSGGLMKPEQFNVMYGGHTFQMMPDGTKPTRKAFEAFTECAAHRFPRVETTMFRPELPSGAVTDEGVNVYVDARGRRAAGDVSIFLDYLARLLPDERDRRIILSWACAVVQNPGKKMLWAPVVQGTEGNGKSLLGECIAYAIGERHVHRPRSKELGSTFNGWLDQRLFVSINEVHMSGRRDLMDDMKPWITDVRLPIRHMQVTETTKHCPVNFYLTTNHQDAVIKTRTDRRYAVFFTAQQHRDDLERDFPDGFFPRLWDWLRDEDGFAAVAHYLDTTPPDAQFDPMQGCVTAPRTSSTDAAITASGGAIETEIRELIESDTPGFRDDWISTGALLRHPDIRALRVSRSLAARVLDGMGYEKWGRAGGYIMAEQCRPVLWRRRGAAEATFADYLTSQGWG